MSLQHVEDPPFADAAPQHQREEQQYHEQQPVHRVLLPRELLFKPLLPPEVEEAVEGSEEIAKYSLQEAATKAIEAWTDPTATGALAAAGEAAEGMEDRDEKAKGISPLTLAYRLSALFVFFLFKQKDPLAVETFGRCLPALLRAASFALFHLLKSPEGRRRLKLSVAAVAEEATSPATAAVVDADPAVPAATPPEAAVPSHMVYEHHAFDFYKELILCLGEVPEGPQGGYYGSSSCSPLPLPAVAGVTFPLLAITKGVGAKMGGCEEAGPQTRGRKTGPPLDDVRVEEEVVLFYGRGFRFRILECIRCYVPAVSGREGYMCLVDAATRAEVSIHLKAVCLPGLLAAASKIKRKKDRFITQLCSIVMNKTLPVRTPQHATESLAKLLPPAAKKVLQLRLKQQKQQLLQAQQQHQHRELIAGSFPVLCVASEVSLPLRLSLLAHATRGLTIALEREVFRDVKNSEKDAEEEAGKDTDKEQQAAEAPLVALHAIQALLFKALELSVPLLPDPFMEPPLGPSCGPSRLLQHQQHQQYTKVRVIERDAWTGPCLAHFCRAASSRASLSAAVVRVLESPVGPLSRTARALPLPCPPQQQQQWTAEELFLWSAVDALVCQSGSLLCRGEETLAYALQRLNICAAPQPQQGDMEVGPLASACLVYGLLILLLGSTSLPSPICLSQRAVWALKAACIFMQHADAEAAAAAAAGTVRQQQQQQQQQKQHLAAAAEGAGIWREARWLLQRKAEQLLVFGVSLLPTIKLQQPQRFETTHSLRAHPALLLLLLLQQMVSGSTSAARGLLLLTQRGASPTLEEEEALSSLGVKDAQDGTESRPQIKSLQSLAVKGGDLTVLYRCIAVLTGLFDWKEQIALFQNLLTPKESQLADSACAAVLILLKDRWCEQVLLQHAASSREKAGDSLASAVAPSPARTQAQSAEDLSPKALNLRLLAFVAQTQLIKRQEPIAEGSERLSCVLNWLKLVLLPGKHECNGSKESNPFYIMGLLLLKTHKQSLLATLRRLASQVDAEEMLMQAPQGDGNFKGGPQCLLSCGVPSTADKIDVIRPCAGGLTSNAAVEQRTRLQLVCLVLREVRDLAHQASMTLEADAGKE